MNNIEQLKEMERLKARVSELESKQSEAVNFLDSFLEEHENKNVRIADLNGFGYIDLRVDDVIDWSEFVNGLKFITPQKGK